MEYETMYQHKTEANKEGHKSNPSQKLENTKRVHNSIAEAEENKTLSDQIYAYRSQQMLPKKVNTR